MDDLISRRAAIDAIQNDVEPFVIVEPGTTCVIGAGVKDADVIAVLEALPSAEPGRKKGKWIDSRDVSWMCSECGKWLDVLQGDVDMNFCPNCGSYNGGEEE